ncbi:MAG: hypothetical protein CM15mV135_120 [uncultured marine virus]|nr:MAG: hypothetical protein CM15mV135_120 [uncultured marine virus]
MNFGTPGVPRDVVEQFRRDEVLAEQAAPFFGGAAGLWARSTYDLINVPQPERLKVVSPWHCTAVVAVWFFF